MLMTAQHFTSTAWEEHLGEWGKSKKLESVTRWAIHRKFLFQPISVPEVELYCSLQKILAAESVVKEETYILPYTHCEVGELLLKEGKFVDARHHLKIAKTRYNSLCACYALISLLLPICLTHPYIVCDLASQILEL